MLLPIHIAAGGLAIVLGAVALSVKNGGDLRRLEDPRQLLAGEISGRVTLTGRLANGDILVDDVVSVTPDGQRLITVPGGETGSQSTLVVLLNYLDRPFEPFSLASVQSPPPHQPSTPDRARRVW